MKLRVLTSYLGSNFFIPLSNLFYRTEKGYKVYKDNNGNEILFRDRSLDKLAIFEQYTLKEYSNLRIKKGSTVVEIGGHIGTSTIGYSEAVGENGKVYSIEADPENYSILEMNIERNDIKNVQLFNEAIVGRKELKHIEIHIDKDNTGGHSIYSSFRKISKSVKVSAQTLDAFMKENNIQKIDVLHMDIEGAEYEILFNMDKKLLRSIPNLIFEYHDMMVDDHDHEELIEYLESLGYTCTKKKDIVTRILNLETGVITATKE